MLGFLFLLTIIVALFTSYYFTNKMSSQRKQILLLKYQNNNLKQVSKTTDNESISIQYICLTCTKGIIKKKCNLSICPMDESVTLNFLNEDTLVEVEDSASINNQLWYEVSIITSERINSKGWIKEEFLELQENTNE